MRRRRLILLGPPAAGKGTHAERLGAELNVPHIATGDMLRHEVEEDTELGRGAKSFMDRGELVPDDVVVQLAVKRLARPDAADGWVLDGFPRNVAQARGLDEQLEGQNVELVIALHVPLEEIIHRISGRRVCPRGHVYHLTRDPPRRPGICDHDGKALYQREDDNEDVVRHRVDVYERKSQPLLRFYETDGLVLRVDGTGPPAEVYHRVAGALEN
jgi:adenylate kinase